MRRYIYKHTCIVPFISKEEIDRDLERMGYGPDNFNVPLVLDESNNGDVTHYAAPIVMDQGMLTMIDTLLSRYGGERYETEFKEFI